MEDRKCTKCLHLKVCPDYRDIKNTLLKTPTRSLKDIDIDSFSNSIAKSCLNYLVYDERSIESFLFKIKDCKRGIEWIIAMCTEGDGKTASRKIITEQSDKWFSDFVDVLRRGVDNLDFVSTDFKDK